MASARVVFKPAAVVMAVGGVVLMIASIYIFLTKANYAYGALTGLVIVLLMVIVGGFEASSAKAVFNTEQGSWRNSLLFTGLSALLKLFTVYVAFDVDAQMGGGDPWVMNLAWACVTMAIFEGAVVVLFLAFKKFFMPTEEEVKASLKKMGGTTVKSMSECPKCHEIAEKDWVQCPQCGTRLPRFCANCGSELVSKSDKCPRCGALVERPEAISKTIVTLKSLSEEEARPEARSVRFARLAEAYLKAGETDNALDAYRKAIHYTEFDRKRSNFMVKMAVILESEGREKEALEVLDAALQLDPEDEAGAQAMKGAILTRAKAKAAKEAYQKGDKTEALRLAEETLSQDTRNHNDTGWIKAEVLVAQAEEMRKSGAKREDVLKVLDEAVQLDPYGKTKAEKMRADLTPKEKKKKRKK